VSRSANIRPEPRVLGDAWRDWDAARDRDGAGVSAGAGLFLAVFALLAVLAALVWLALIWIAQPRLAALGLGPSAQGALGALGSLALIAPALAPALACAGAQLPRGVARLAQRAAVSAWPGASAAGSVLGLSRDRLGHSFLRVTNRLAVLAGLTGPGRELLLLAPRCLRSDVRESLQRIAAEHGARFAIAGGGGQAREHIERVRPAGVLAVACERDLVEGVRTVAPRLAVLSLPNRRPEGPCRNSEIDLAEARRLLALLGRVTRGEA
jgi:uncharacterized protein